MSWRWRRGPSQVGAVGGRVAGPGHPGDDEVRFEGAELDPIETSSESNAAQLDGSSGVGNGRLARWRVRPLGSTLR